MSVVQTYKIKLYLGLRISVYNMSDVVAVPKSGALYLCLLTDS